MAIPTLNNYAMPSQWKANKVNWTLDPKRAALLIHDMQEYFTAFYGENSPLIAALTERLEAPAAVLQDNRELLEPLTLCYQSLHACGMGVIADGPLLDCLRRAATFGLFLVRLDVRQDAARHAAALPPGTVPGS